MYRPAIYFSLSYQDHCYLNSSELVGKLKQYCACTKMHYLHQLVKGSLCLSEKASLHNCFKEQSMSTCM